MLSELVIHTLETGDEEVLFAADGIFEAPNWHPSGDYLVINSNGRIYRVDFENPKMIEIPTGDCLACNNDHGISPDGRTLVISESPGRGTSCIYRLPISGGVPERVTDNTPSYWHGWSPDGSTLTYTAIRDGDFNIFTIPVDGGAETQITFGPGHKDGPDYTPDGEWIWYNSDHHGNGADLWRIRVDGTDLEQMTDDPMVNWFPHPSPDGTTVLYLAYPEGTEGHPFGRDVELRLMPSDGGKPRTLATFFGGQGTINVPNWSPDSSKFAYVRFIAPAEDL